MSDENILINIDDTEIDATLAKLNEALEKQAKLISKPTTTMSSPDVPVSSQAVNNTVTNNIVNQTVQKNIFNQINPQSFVKYPFDSGAFSSFWNTIEEQQGKLQRLQKQAQTITQASNKAVSVSMKQLMSLDTFRDQLGSRMGTDVSRMNSMLSAMKRMGSSANIISGLGGGALALFFQFYQLQEQKRLQQETEHEQLKSDLMRLQDLTTAEFAKWEENQRRLNESYRSGVIP